MHTGVLFKELTLKQIPPSRVKQKREKEPRYYELFSFQSLSLSIILGIWIPVVFILQTIIYILIAQFFYH